MGSSDLMSFAYFTLCPRLQTYDLVQNEKVAGVRYRRYAITKKGTQFFAYIEKMLHKTKSLKKNTAEEKKLVKKDVESGKQ